MMPAASIKPAVVATVEPTGVMPGSIATVMRTLVTMPVMARTVGTPSQIKASLIHCCLIFRPHRLNGSPV
jgi:hypothetical protein